MTINANISSLTYGPVTNYLNLYIKQGTDWQANITLMNGNNLANLVNCVAVSEVKDFYNSNTIIFAFSTSLNAQNSILTLSVTANVTDSLTSGIRPNRYDYDVLLINQTTN